MDLVSLAFAAALGTTPPREGAIDFDAPLRAAESELDSPALKDRMTAAMAWPYRYGVTQMPCKAREWQPLRGWTPAREPSGKIQWVQGPRLQVRWSGIYGTCFIQSPVARDKIGAIERAALECECNGWLPRPLGEIPAP
jgi:hypothetical protein